MMYLYKHFNLHFLNILNLINIKIILKKTLKLLINGQNMIGEK